MLEIELIYSLKGKVSVHRSVNNDRKQLIKNEWFYLHGVYGIYNVRSEKQTGAFPLSGSSPDSLATKFRNSFSTVREEKGSCEILAAEGVRNMLLNNVYTNVYTATLFGD